MRKRPAAPLSALEQWIELLLVHARHGARNFGALTSLVSSDAEKIAALEADTSIPAATRRRLIRECDASIGAVFRKAAKYRKVEALFDVLRRCLQRAPFAEPNQHRVFSAYRTALRRHGTDEDGKVIRAPTIAEWLAEDLRSRKNVVTAKFRMSRGLALREMARRFKLPLTSDDLRRPI